jgi:hypothetical protein
MFRYIFLFLVSLYHLTGWFCALYLKYRQNTTYYYIILESFGDSLGAGLPLMEVRESFTPDFGLWLPKYNAFPSLPIKRDFQHRKFSVSDFKILELNLDLLGVVSLGGWEDVFIILLKNLKNIFISAVSQS